MGCVSSRRAGPALPEVKINPGDFHLENVVADKLGKGTYASVYAVSKADDEEPKYAAKVVELRVRGDNDFNSSANMVTRELQILQKVADTGSKYVIHFKESFAEGHFVYMVMEMCDATLLCALKGEETLTENTYRPIFQQMLWGLAAVHAVGIVHRDVKPDNFMCSGAGAERVVKLCDFGLARAMVHANRSDLSGVNGTAPFLAPEMVKGVRYGAKVDVWSVGVIAYLLLYGHFPYMPLVWRASEMKRAIRDGCPGPVYAPRIRGKADPALADAISIEAEGLVGKLLARAPRDRPTAAEASEHEFFERPEADEALPSLLPMLLSAEHCGGFEQPREKEEAPSELDVVLACKQVQRGHTSEWSRQTSANSEAMSESTGFYRAISSTSTSPGLSPTSTSSGRVSF